MTARDRVVLVEGDARAEIALAGAELRTWRVDDRDLIWAPYPVLWPDTAPVLFPVVGWTRGAAVRVDGVAYPLGLHGFARSRRFTVVEQWPSRVRLRLLSDEATRALYPFAFVLDVEYALGPRSLEIVLSITNTGERAMPYACGLHPGFRWPFDGGDPDDYEIVFEHRERSSVPIISPDGLFTRQMRPVPVDGRHLRLSPELFAREALCFLEARSRKLSFVRRSGAALDVALDDFPHVALWSRPPGRFLCIEAWTGRGDDVDADGDLFRKASMRHLPAGAEARHAATFGYRSQP